MIEQILKFLEQAGGVINLFAVAVIVVGFFLAWGRYAFRFSSLAAQENFRQFKIELGHALLLGLEILVVADVIETITVEPSFKSLGVLAFLVVVRTAVSWTLSLEIEGRWPWQVAPEGQAND
jgi:uncharacterized membrane protein